MKQSPLLTSSMKLLVMPLLSLCAVACGATPTDTSVEAQTATPTASGLTVTELLVWMGVTAPASLSRDLAACLPNSPTVKNCADSAIVKSIGAAIEAGKAMRYGICLSGSRAKNDCDTVSVAQAICLSGGRAAGDCSSVSVAQAICLSGGRAVGDCRSVSMQQAICLSGKRSARDCQSISASEAICLSGGRPKNECSN